MTQFVELKFANGKTFLSGIGNFIHGSELKNFMKNLEDHLKLKMIKKRIGDELECEFEGDNKDKIKEFLLNKLSIDENSIKINCQDENQTDEKEKEKEKNENDNIINKINKKISFYLVKIKSRYITYIVGLRNFLNESEIESIKKNLQKLLGTNSNTNENGDCGFNGDYTHNSDKINIIKNCISKNPKISKDFFDF